MSASTNTVDRTSIIGSGGMLLVYPTELTPSMALADYDPIDPIWDSPHNRYLQLVAEFHEALTMDCHSYHNFYHGLNVVQRDQFITALVLALGSDPQSYSAPDQLVTAGVKWCIDQGFSYENHGEFLEARDWLRSGGVGVFLELSGRFGDVLERDTPNPRVISALQDPAIRDVFAPITDADIHSIRVEARRRAHGVGWD